MSLINFIPNSDDRLMVKPTDDSEAVPLLGWAVMNHRAWQDGPQARIRDAFYPNPPGNIVPVYLDGMGKVTICKTDAYSVVRRPESFR